MTHTSRRSRQLPFGSTQSGCCDAQGVMDLSLELNVRMDFVDVYLTGAVLGSCRTPPLRSASFY